MPETINNKTIFTLREVALSIRKTISERYGSAYWIKAEMNKLNHYKASGHCYPDLVEKLDGKIVSQMRAILWKDDYEKINARFLSTLNEPLKDGIKILLCASISYDPVYGLSLRIVDMDPSFSLGELELEKQNTIDQLKNEGLFAQNKSLQLATLPKRIAIISVQTSKGYSDFLTKTVNNAWGYKLQHHLFPSLLQGDRASAELVQQLEIIKAYASYFDAVAIIRGGGGDIGLSCYNDYELCRTICTYPLPVLTGIGHATNETVAEMVSYKNCITPTDLADFLIQRFHDFARPLNEMEQVIKTKTRQLISQERKDMLHMAGMMKNISSRFILQNQHELFHSSQRIRNESRFILQKGSQESEHMYRQLKENCKELLRDDRQNLVALQNSLTAQVTSQVRKPLSQLGMLEYRLDLHARQLIRQSASGLSNLENKVMAMDPVNVLKRGFTITLSNGHPVIKSSDVAKEQEVTTITSAGSFTSIVKNIKPEHE